MEHRLANDGQERAKRRYSPTFYAQISERYKRKRDIANLLRIQTTLRLSNAELARLFHGVSRQAVGKWLEKGVPLARVAEVSRNAELVTTLTKVFKADRLPSITRAQIPGLDGRSILEVVATDGVGPVYALLNRLRSYVPAA